MKTFLRILLPLLVTLTLIASACDDKKDDHKDCGCPLEAGVMLDGGQQMPEAGVEEQDAGEEAGAQEGGDMAGDMAGSEPCECEGEGCAC